jgi:hypothetical protein
VLRTQAERPPHRVVANASPSITRDTHDTAFMRLTQAGAVPVTSFSLSGEFTVDHRSALGPLDQRLMREHVLSMAMGTAVYVGAPAQAQSDDPAAAAVLRRWQRIRRRRPAGEPVRAGGAPQRPWVTAACSDGTWAAGGSECRSR